MLTIDMLVSVQEVYQSSWYNEQVTSATSCRLQSEAPPAGTIQASNVQPVPGVHLLCMQHRLMFHGLTGSNPGPDLLPCGPRFGVLAVPYKPLTLLAAPFVVTAE